jgi:hypothetical protein
MKPLRVLNRTIAWPAAIAAFPLGIMQVVSCGSGNENSGGADQDSGSEATVIDASNDAAAHGDTTLEASGDSGVEADTGTAQDATSDLDAPPGLDSSPGIDSSPGVDSSQLDAADAGSGDTGASTCAVSVPDSASGLLGAITTVVCNRWQVGCGLNGSQFNAALCQEVYGTSGFQNVGAAAAFLDGGRIGYDPTAACQCLELNTGLAPGLIAQSYLIMLQTTCLSAYVGTSPIGDGGCVSSYECVPGGFCNDPADGGLGTCMALVPEGGQCANSDMCNYVATGVRELYCNSALACGPTLEAGSECTGDLQCSSNSCIGATCQGGYNFASPALCGDFTVSPGDGGSGG